MWYQTIKQENHNKQGYTAIPVYSPYFAIKILREEEAGV